jgi:hypothetical protein
LEFPESRHSAQDKRTVYSAFHRRRQCHAAYWNEIINFPALERHGMISPADLGLFQFVDDPASALLMLQTGIAAEPEAKTPAFAHSRTQPQKSAEALAECL